MQKKEKLWHGSEDGLRYKRVPFFRNARNFNTDARKMAQIQRRALTAPRSSQTSSRVRVPRVQLTDSRVVLDFPCSRN